MPDSFGENLKLYLWPDSTVSNQWSIQTNVFGHTAHAALSINNTTTNYYLYENADNQKLHVGLHDISNYINESDVTAIEKITVHMYGTAVQRSDSVELTCELVSETTTSVINSYSETIDVTTTGLATKYDWTERTTSDGSNPWTVSDVNDIQLRIRLTDPGAGDVRIFWVYLCLHFTSVPPSFETYTSGNDVVIPKGLVEIKKGTSEIKKS